MKTAPEVVGSDRRGLEPPDQSRTDLHPDYGFRPGLPQGSPAHGLRHLSDRVQEVWKDPRGTSALPLPHLPEDLLRTPGAAPGRPAPAVGPGAALPAPAL